MKYSTSLVVLLGAIFIFAPVLRADSTSLRCGNNLVSIGDTMYKVRRACGDPVLENRVGERKTYRVIKEKRLGIEDVTYITEWVYEKHQGEYILTFEGSRLVHKEYSK